MVRAKHKCDWVATRVHLWGSKTKDCLDSCEIPVEDYSDGVTARDAIERALQSTQDMDIVFFYYGLGTEDSLVGWEQGRPIIDRDNCHLLEGTMIYSIACHAGAELGPASHRAGARCFFGYDAYFWIPRTERGEQAVRQCAEKGFAEMCCNSVSAGTANMEMYNEYTRLFHEWHEKEGEFSFTAFCLMSNRSALSFHGEYDFELSGTNNRENCSKLQSSGKEL